MSSEQYPRNRQYPVLQVEEVGMQDGMMTRRDMIKGSIAGVAAAALATSARAAGKPTAGGKSACYKADGSFDDGAAKEAYFSMMKALGYPIQDALRTDEFWACDFLQRDFAKVGLGGIFWINEKGLYRDAGVKAYRGEHKDERYTYFGMEIYLLPGQMLPEHSHIGNEGVGPKMEAWHVRYGTVDYFGEHKGEGTETLISDMPKKERPWGCGEPWFKAKYVTKRTASSGKPYVLKDPTSWHFQRAGAEGAVVTEYATYHNHIRFSKPGMDFAGSKAK
ncbi:twin-arginine translocation signal domain-containing protein [Verrucomicrobiota bacterium]